MLNIHKIISNWRKLKNYKNLSTKANTVSGELRTDSYFSVEAYEFNELSSKILESYPIFEKYLTPEEQMEIKNSR